MLNHFPPEILDFILGSDFSSHRVLLLWKCGDQLLNSKLSTAIAQLHLQNQRPGFCPTTVARLPFSLRFLRSLTICSASTLADNPIEASKLISSLPATLEALNICAAHCLYAFMNHAPESTYTTPKTLSTQYQRGFSRLISMETLFPRLQSLIIDDNAHSTSIDYNDVAALPSTLTYLEVLTKVDNSEWSLYITLLPSQLRHIKRVSLRNSVRDSWPTGILPELHTLDFEADPYLGPHTLPPSLTRCPTNFRWNLALARSWPLPNLTHLSLYDLDHDSFLQAGTQWFLELPKSVTSIEMLIFNAEFQQTIPFSDLHHLPPTVTNFECDFIANDDGAITHLKNQSLKTLLLNFDSDYSPLILPLLPQGLKKLQVYLSIDQTNGETALKANDLPPDLTYLNLVTSPMYSSYKGQFPQHLTDLVLSHGRMSQENFNLLPNSITRLVLSFDRHHSKNDIPNGWRLPTSITSLQINQWPSDELGAMSKYGLTHLEIQNLTGIETSSAAQNEALFEALPTSLTSLVLSQPYPHTPLQNQRITHLQSLTLLSIANLGTFDSIILRSVPETCLNSLSVRLSSIREIDASWIPQRLQELSLGLRVYPPWLGEYWPLFARQIPSALIPAVKQRLRKFTQGGPLLP